MIQKNKFLILLSNLNVSAFMTDHQYSAYMARDNQIINKNSYTKLPINYPDNNTISLKNILFLK